MSRVERKEYQETKVLRTRSPVRTRGSAQNLTEFDNNLDNLLEDLQNSVSRPGAITPYKETRTINYISDGGRSSSADRITNLRAANPVTEYASDDSYSYMTPDGTKSVKTVKKEMYSYKTSGGGGGEEIVPEKNRMQNNINQLDSLLDDLQQVKQSSGSYNKAGGEPGFREYSKSKVISGKTVIERDIVYPPDTPKSGRSRTLDRSEREGSVTRDVQYSKDATYGEKQTKVTNVHTYPLEVIETTTPDINPQILANLDPNLLPPGNTKVTTTIKTYTYEIPGAVYPSPTATTDTEKYVYSPNQSASTPSKSFVYNKYETDSLTRNYQTDQKWQGNVYRETTTNVPDQPPYQKPSPPLGGSERTVVKESVTTRNYQPGNVYAQSPGTYVYNESTTTKLGNEGYTDDRARPIGTPPSSRGYPPGKETVIIKESHTTNIGPSYAGYPPQPPSHTTVVYRDSHTTDHYGGKPYPRNEVETFDPKYPPHPVEGGGRPNEPVNITYKYTSSSSTTNNYKGRYPPGDESVPLLQPRPFPVDDVDNPPKKLDELMATIGKEPPNSPLNAGFNAHEIELAQQKKVESIKQQHQELEQKKESKDIQRTKNVTGPPVYYPPGHELFVKKEESGGGWKAEGAMARESGKYKYEAESKSKSETKTGAAIVPVCLPLCCGLPCTIL